MLRKLIGVHIAHRIHLTERDPGAVAAVRADQLLDLLRTRVVALGKCLQIHIDPVTVIVHRQDFLLEAACLKVLRPRDNRIHRPPRLLGRHILIHHLPAAPRVDEVIEADAVDPLFLDEVKDLIELHDVVVIDRKAQPHALTDGDAVLNALHRPLVRTVHAAEHIVHIRQTVERDADIAHAEILDALCHIARDERPIRRERRTHAALCRVFRELEKVRADQRLAAREEQHGHAELCEIVDEALCLLRRQLPVIFLPVRLHIAVAAAQIARARRVPDHHGSHALRCTALHPMRIVRVAQRITIVLIHKKKFRYTDHWYS